MVQENYNNKSALYFPFKSQCEFFAQVDYTKDFLLFAKKKKGSCLWLFRCLMNGNTRTPKFLFTLKGYPKCIGDKVYLTQHHMYIPVRLSLQTRDPANEASDTRTRDFVVLSLVGPRTSSSAIDLISYFTLFKVPSVMYPY